MWKFFSKCKLLNKPKPVVKTGTEEVVKMLVEQCCAWYEIPIQTVPEVIVYENATETKAIYDYRADTIFVYGLGNANPGVLAHEVAHAVIHKHGKISPRMHEILAGYAEYKITKVFKD